MPTPGTLVEYIEQSKFICGLVTENQGKRLKILNQNGRETKLPSTRIIHASKEKKISTGEIREKISEQLRNASKRRQTLMEGINLEEIWELASEEQDSTFQSSFLAELCFGEQLDDDHNAAFLRSIFKDRLFFKYKDGKINAFSPETVEQLKAQQAREEEKRVFLAQSTKFLMEMANGNYQIQWPDREKTLKLLADYYINGNECEEWELAKDLVKSSGLYKTHDIYYLLVKIGFWQKDENLTILRHSLEVGFPEIIMGNLGNFEKERITPDRQRDYTKLPIFTIDGDQTKDFDDALHLEKKNDHFLVGVHISDIANLVHPTTSLFKEALNRITSIYFPDSNLPMLPPEISENSCSLLLNEQRAAMSFMISLNGNGEILDYDIFPSKVKVKKQLTYTEAEEMIDTDPTLKDLFFLSKKLQEQRVSTGAMLLQTPELHFSFSSSNEVDIEVSEVDSRSRMLIAEFMILANTLAAQYLSENEIPGLFRSQAPAKQRLFHGCNPELYLRYRQRRHLSPGVLSSRVKAHSGVGVQNYTTVTSPIRRFLDLLMQYQIFQHQSDRNKIISKKELNNYSARISSTQSRANMIYQQRNRYWVLKFLEKSIGKKVEALIIIKGPKRIHILLTSVLLEYDLPASQAISASPGDLVPVRVAKVNALSNILKLEW
jgi:exoribonuclease II